MHNTEPSGENLGTRWYRCYHNTVELSYPIEIRFVGLFAQNFIICIEMFLAAVAHHMYFSYQVLPVVVCANVFTSLFLLKIRIILNCFMKLSVYGSSHIYGPSMYLQ